MRKRERGKERWGGRAGGGGGREEGGERGEENLSLWCRFVLFLLALTGEALSGLLTRSQSIILYVIGLSMLVVSFSSSALFPSLLDSSLFGTYYF